MKNTTLLSLIFCSGIRTQVNWEMMTLHPGVSAPSGGRKEHCLSSRSWDWPDSISSELSFGC